MPVGSSRGIFHVALTAGGTIVGFQSNAAALQAYVRQGFSIVGTARRHAKIRNAYIDAIIVERLLIE